MGRTPEGRGLVREVPGEVADKGCSNSSNTPVSDRGPGAAEIRKLSGAARYETFAPPHFFDLQDMSYLPHTGLAETEKCGDFICNLDSYMFRIITAAMLLFLMLAGEREAVAVSEAENTFLSMYFKEEELVVLSATRSLQSISRIAEDISFVTAEEIELMNAHTVADALAAVNGIQLRSRGGPGSISLVTIQGSDVRHVTVFVDGVQINNLGDNLADIAVLPVQIMEKIEIIKGPASSQWGSSLGGVVNVITKSGAAGGSPRGMVSASHGERDVSDVRAELSGEKGNLGYYLFAGRLHNGGLTRGFGVTADHLYSRLSLGLSRETTMELTVLYGKGDRGRGEDPVTAQSSGNRFANFISTFSLAARLDSRLALQASMRASSLKSNFQVDDMRTGSRLSLNTNHDRGYGASMKLTWDEGVHSAVAGIDYDYGKLEANYISGGRPVRRKSAVFINDTVSLGRFSATAGVRYDHMKSSAAHDNFFSPSIGVTYSLEQTIFRAYFARGFNIPSLGITSGDSQSFGYKANPALGVEKIRSYQLGVESGILKFMWLKLAAFSHHISDVISAEAVQDPVYSITYVNQGRQRRQGAEMEFKTVPVGNFTFTGGAMIIGTRDLLTDRLVKGVPTHSYDLGVRYEGAGLRALLKGRYIWWNTEAPGGRYGDFIFDLTANKELYKKSGTALEAFLSAHNLLNGDQYFYAGFPNPRRWFEAGVRMRF